MNQHGESEWVKLVKHAQVHGACAVHRFTEHARFRLSVLLLGLAVYVPVFCSMRSHMAWTWVSFHFSKAEQSVQSDLVLTVQYRLGLCTLISQPFCPPVNFCCQLALIRSHMRRGRGSQLSG